MRDQSFDIMKGIGILAMILGHLGMPTAIDRFIYAWHMPLFFIVSGYFFHQISIKESFVKNARNLLVPYFLTAIVLALCAFLKSHLDIATLQHHAISIFVGSGSGKNPTELASYFVGAIWFLLALFWCRIGYNAVMRYISVSYQGGVLALSVAAVIAGQYILVPTDVLRGIGAMLFFHVGYLARQHQWFQHKPQWWLIIAILIMTAISAYMGSMSMVRNHYSCYPVNVVAAIGFTYLMYWIAKYITRFPLCTKWLSHWGMLSLLILCLHIVELDYDFIPGYFFRLPIEPHICIILRWCYQVVIVLAVTELASRIKIVRKIFNLK